MWKVRREDVDFFLADLWKDRRGFQNTGPTEFGKDCFSEEDARFEELVLGELQQRLPEKAVPQVYRREDAVLYMERISGIRLFDLIRHLKIAERGGSTEATVARSIVMERAGARLREVQFALAEMVGDGTLSEVTPYPLELKVRNILEFFIRVLDLRDQPDGWSRELAHLQERWTSTYATVPFRDATTKNMIVRISQDDEFGDRSDDIESWQRQQLVALLRHKSSYWEHLVLTDVDFSSAVNLSTPEDDPISLFFHEWTIGTVPLSSKSLVLDGRLGSPDPERAATTLLVRYLRFGGRKLAYQLVNSQGFAVRFAYDNPLYYFEHVRSHCEIVDPGFGDKVPALLGLLELIAYAVRSSSPQDRNVTQIDHLRRFGKTANYWQQSPLEGDPP